MEETTWSLTAFGCAGQVEISIDKSGTEPTIYEMTISLPSVELRFTIHGPDTALELSRFLSEHANRRAFAKQQIGSLCGMSLELIKDSEFADRFYLRATGSGMIDVSVVDPLTSDLIQAAIQLAHDITTEP